MSVRRLDELIDQARTIVCAGPGGVGKTTTAAAIGLEAARRGRRAVVVTIDPAKRLADALGLDEGLGNEPARVTLPSARGRSGRRGAGELWATMLDTRATFDGVVRRYAGTPAQADQILANRFYRNISGALSGTQEYMAAEKLYELHRDDRFDLVVIDTPPTRNALDFLDAPARLTRFLDHRLYRALMLPTRVGMRVVNFAAQAFVKTVARVVGGEVIAEVVAFFQAFDGMEAGFRARAEEVAALLADDATNYVIVTSPRHESVAEAEYFAARLARQHLRVAAVVVNRMHPLFGVPSPEALADLADEAERAAIDPAAVANLRELAEVARAEAEAIAPLRARVGAAPFAAVPLLVTDVHDLDGLAMIRGHLFAAGGAAE